MPNTIPDCKCYPYHLLERYNGSTVFDKIRANQQAVDKEIAQYIARSAQCLWESASRRYSSQVEHNGGYTFKTTQLT
jgi:hypothetical protein